MKLTSSHFPNTCFTMCSEIVLLNCVTSRNLLLNCVTSRNLLLNCVTQVEMLQGVTSEVAATPPYPQLPHFHPRRVALPTLDATVQLPAAANGKGKVKEREVGS